LKGIILDIDGVLRRGNDVIPRSLEAVEKLLEKGLKICYLTNNSTKTRAQVLKSLTQMGFPSSVIVTSAQAAADLILFNKIHARCLVVGEEGLYKELKAAGHKPIYAGNVDPRRRFDFVVAGLDRDLTYDKIKDALNAIRNGARFIATNTDPTLPIEGGGVTPGAGATVAAIIECTGIDPIIVGKPEPFSTRLALSKMELNPEDVLMVGDRVDTDIAAGLAARCNVALVLTGDVKEVRDDSFPIYKDLLELADGLQI
jgi:4-nitrophenyl phosphatase